MRDLQNFKKDFSIVEAKGYCYGWQFYLAGDADIVIASEEALVRPRLLSLCRLGRAHVAMGADHGRSQIPWKMVFHRPSFHRPANV